MLGDAQTNAEMLTAGIMDCRQAEGKTIASVNGVTTLRTGRIGHSSANKTSSIVKNMPQDGKNLYEHYNTLTNENV